MWTLQGTGSALARRQVRLEIEAVTQVLALLQDVLEEGTVLLVLHHRLDQVELVHGDQLQDLGARLAARVAGQRMHACLTLGSELQML